MERCLALNTSMSNPWSSAEDTMVYVILGCGYEKVKPRVELVNLLAGVWGLDELLETVRDVLPELIESPVFSSSGIRYLTGCISNRIFVSEDDSQTRKLVQHPYPKQERFQFHAVRKDMTHVGFHGLHEITLRCECEIGQYAQCYAFNH